MFGCVAALLTAPFRLTAAIVVFTVRLLVVLPIRLFASCAGFLLNPATLRIMGVLVAAVFVLALLAASATVASAVVGVLLLAGLLIGGAKIVGSWRTRERREQSHVSEPRRIVTSKEAHHGDVLGQLLALSPGEFESVVADVLRRRGFRDVRLVGGPGDLNVDIWCRDPKGLLVAVQCKRYAPARRIGSKDIQTFVGMIFGHHEAKRGIFVTTSDYTPQARSLATERRIELVNGAALVRLVRVART